jgi:hypothetical protein
MAAPWQRDIIARAQSSKKSRRATVVWPKSLAESPFGLLDESNCLRLVTDFVAEDDALCLALTCRAMRDALWGRFPRRAKIPMEKQWKIPVEQIPVEQVRATPRRPRSRATFSLLRLYSHREARANVHLPRQPNTLLAVPDPSAFRQAAADADGRAGRDARAAALGPRAAGPAALAAGAPAAAEVGGDGLGQRARRGLHRDTSDCRFGKTATDYDRQPGIKRLSCTA